MKKSAAELTLTMIAPKIRPVGLVSWALAALPLRGLAPMRRLEWLWRNLVVHVRLLPPLLIPPYGHRPTMSRRLPACSRRWGPRRPVCLTNEIAAFCFAASCWSRRAFGWPVALICSGSCPLSFSLGQAARAVVFAFRHRRLVPRPIAFPAGHGVPRGGHGAVSRPAFESVNGLRQWVVLRARPTRRRPSATIHPVAQQGPWGALLAGFDVPVSVVGLPWSPPRCCRSANRRPAADNVIFGALIGTPGAPRKPLRPFAGCPRCVWLWWCPRSLRPPAPDALLRLDLREAWMFAGPNTALAPSQCVGLGGCPQSRGGGVNPDLEQALVTARPGAGSPSTQPFTSDWIRPPTSFAQTVNDRTRSPRKPGIVSPAIALYFRICGERCRG